MGFFINQIDIPNCDNSLINIKGDKVIVDLPLDLYVDDNNNVYVGREESNAMLIYINDDEIYVRRVI